MFIQKFYSFRKMNEATDLGADGGAVADLDNLGGDVNENFDDLDYESEGSKELNQKLNQKFKDRIEKAKGAKKQVDDESDDEEDVEPKKKERSAGLDALDSEEEDEEKKPSPRKVEKDKEDPEKKEDKKESEEKKTEEEDKDTPKADTKKLKLRMSDGLYGVESDAKVRVKIDGDFQEVPLQELINNYSGKTAWDKKFTELGNEKKTVETLRLEVSKSQEFIRNTVKEVTAHLTDNTKNPLEALYHLVEKSGGDIYTTYKRTIEANLEEVEKLLSMSELERENYWLKKQNEFRTKTETARKAEADKEASYNQGLQKLASLRQAHGVSEEQFLQALDELESQGQDTNKLSDEYVVNYASLKPHVESVQDVLQPYEDSIDDSKYSEIVRNFARQLRAKEYTIEQLKEWARTQFMDEDLKDLQSRTKAIQKPSSKAETKTPQKLETLDFDDEE